MNRKTFFLLSAILALSAVLPMGTALDATASTPSEGACLRWDISGRWQYRVSRGGYGLMDIRQDAAGGLSGTWHNEASDASGTLYGQIVGASFGLHVGETAETLEGTVNADGLKIGGTYQDVDYQGSWEATGSATCLLRQPPPTEGSAYIEFRWGDYLFYADIPPAVMLQSLQQQVTSPQINTPLGATIRITARFRETGLPPTITVVGQTGTGPEVAIGTLTRVSEGPSGSVYRGTVFVPATGLTPGVSRRTVVRLIDPRDVTRRIPVTVVNQFLIDPAGYVYSTSTSERLPDAMATLYKKVGSDWVMWPAEQFGQTNPLPTDSEGHYAWETDPGEFQVVTRKAGYTDGKGGPVTVPPPVLDLNIGMTPTANPAYTLSDLWVSGATGVKKTEFMPGEALQAHLVITNPASSDMQVDVNWMSIDPDGSIVSSLSGSSKYLVGPFSVDLKISAVIPLAAKEGWHTLKVTVEKEGQSQFRGTQFWVAPAQHIGFFPALLRNLGQVTPPPTDQWVTLLSDDFEGQWPGAWQLSNYEGVAYSWGKRDCRPYQGSYSAWAIGGGAAGAGLACGAEYPVDSRSWMVYGPFSLADATAAELRFQAWVDSESEYDLFFWGASTDGDNFSGWNLSGSSREWAERVLDLADVPNMGSLLGQDQVWIALVFDSDGSVVYPEGAYVDDLVIRKKTGSVVAVNQRLAGLGNGRERLAPAHYARP